MSARQPLSMQFPFTSKELKDLLEMTSLAVTMASVDMQEVDERYTRWKELHNKLFSLALDDKSLAGLIDYPNETGEGAFKPDYIEKSYYMEKLNDYSEHVFWSDLVTRLADKALEEHLGTEEFEEMTEEERRAMAEPMEKSLWNECSTYGIDRLGFIMPPTDA